MWQTAVAWQILAPEREFLRTREREAASWRRGPRRWAGGRGVRACVHKINKHSGKCFPSTERSGRKRSESSAEARPPAAPPTLQRLLGRRCGRAQAREPGPSLRRAACARGASPCAGGRPPRPRASSLRGPEPDIAQRAVSDPLSLLPGRLGLHEIAFRKGMRISAREGLAKAARGAGCPRAGEASLRAPTPTPAAPHRALEKSG